jgi:hypothetical protein
MIRSSLRRALIVIVILTAVTAGFAQEDEQMWPRVMNGKSATVTMFPPQLDSWEDGDFEARASVATRAQVSTRAAVGRTPAGHRAARAAAVGRGGGKSQY